MDDEKRQQIGRAGQREEWNISSKRAEHPTHELRDDHTADRAEHSAEADDRSDCGARKDVDGNVNRLTENA